MGDEKGSCVERQVLMGGGAEGQVVQVNSAGSDFDASSAIAFEVGVSDDGLGRTGAAVDGHAAPVETGTGSCREANTRRGGALRQESSAVSDDKAGAGSEIKSRAGFDGKRRAVGDCDTAGDV